MLDASALLAYLHREPGADQVAEALATGAVISAVNLSEALTVLGDAGEDPGRIATEVERILDVVPFDSTDAVGASELRAATRKMGLSLGDRACLALGSRLGKPVLTADRRWSRLRVGLDLRQIRD